MNQIRRLSLWRDDSGTAIIESAFVAPVLLTLLYGIYEFAFLFYQQQLMSVGVRDAARFLSRYNYVQSDGATPCVSLDATCPSLAAASTVAQCLATNATTTCATSDANRIPGWTTTTGGLSIGYVASPAYGATSACGSGGCNGAQYACSVGGVSFASCVYTVQFSSSFVDPSLGLFGALGMTPPTINVSHVERVVGPG